MHIEILEEVTAQSGNGVAVTFSAGRTTIGEGCPLPVARMLLSIGAAKVVAGEKPETRTPRRPRKED